MPLLLPPQIVNVEWDHVTQRIVLPADWRELSEEDKHKVPLIQIRGYLPREFEFLPDWAIWGMTFCPGFALMSDLTVATGSGARVKTVTIKTSGTTFTVPGDWNNASNTIECLAGGGSGASGASGASGGGAGGRGGGGGGGGAYSKGANVALTAAEVKTLQIGIANGTAVTGATWFGSTTTIFASTGVAGAAASGGAGGATASCIGDTKYAGGTGGIGANTGNDDGNGGGGGGGAGYISSNGGTGINGAGKSAGAGGTSGPTAAGAAGTIWTQTSPAATAGPGGGGHGGNGGSQSDSGSGSAGSTGSTGGLYGSGGGGGGGGGSGGLEWDGTSFIPHPGGSGRSGGVGKQGIIVISNNSDL